MILLKTLLEKLFFFILLIISSLNILAQNLRPNNIFILTDDQRWDALGYAVNKNVYTPKMDRLASECTYFTNAFATTPIRTDSRASIITGLYEHTHQYNFQTNYIKDEYTQNSQPLLLKKSGYFTGFFGKFGMEYSQLIKLYDVFDSYDRDKKYYDKRGYFYKTIEKDTVHLIRYTGQQALEFIESAPNDKPYFYHIKKDPLENKNLVFNKKYKNQLDEFINKLNQRIINYKDPYSGVPSGLTVNFNRLDNHLITKDHDPVFSWIVPKEANYQLGFQILVSSTREKSDLNEGDLWNSKQVRGNQSLNILYKGKALKPLGSYFWKVRIWDSNNRNSEYSKPQSFKISNGIKSYNDTSIFQIDTIRPLEFRKLKNSYFFDFGKDAFATLQVIYHTEKSEYITIRLGEQLNDNGTINMDPGASSVRSQEIELAVNPSQSIYSINLKKDLRNTKAQAAQMPKSFPVVMPFRYVEIEGSSQNLTRDNIKQIVYHTYFDDNMSSFYSSNDILNQVWDLCKYSIKATSFTGLYVDGDRERIPYEADAYINQLGHYATDREYNIAKNTIEYFMQYPTWPTEWQLHVALMLEQDYLYTGNTRLIETYYETLKHKTLFELSNEDELISTKSPKLTREFMKKLGFKDSVTLLKDIVDWPPAQKDTNWKLATQEGERDGFVFMPYNSVINALYIKNMQIMAEFANILNKSLEENDFKIRALKAKKSFNDKMLSKATNIYTDGIGTDHSSIHANMFALAFNLVPKENIKSVVEFIKSRGMACSVYGAQYLLEALYNANESDYALKLLTSKSDRSWYNMIKSGSTITMEAWDNKYKPNQDWNHAWGAVPANAIPRLMWGIKPKTPGANIIQIKPQLANLTHSEIKVPFIGGEVCASYIKTGLTSQEYTFEIPANMSAELMLEYAPNNTVILNGRIVNLVFGSIRLNSGINKVELTANTF